MLLKHPGVWWNRSLFTGPILSGPAAYRPPIIVITRALELLS